MRKRIIVILMAAVMMTGCSDALPSSVEVQATDGKTDADAGWGAVQAPEELETLPKAEAVPGPEMIPESESAPRSESVPEPESAPKPESVPEPESAPKPESVPEPECVPESEADSESGTVQESAAAQSVEAVPEETPEHICSLGGGTVTVLAFGQQEPNCFYGAKYDVKCAGCGEYLDVIYQEPLGHTGDEGVVTCEPDCTGEGSVRYTCIRCGAEWSEAYGQIQPHTWVEGIKKETDWENGGTKEVPYLYCSVCGKREGSE